MKKIIFTAIILFGCLSFKFATAQVHIGVGLNISSQPDWGPVGYDNAAYYYIPGIDGYYDVNAHQYIYLENNVWVHRGYLPVRYRNYDLYHGYKVVINDRDPWLRHAEYRRRYASYSGRRDQQIIRNSRDVKYREHWRGVRENQRAHNQNVRARHLNHRNQQENQRAHHLNQKEHNLNQKQRNLNRQSHDDKKTPDHHD